MQDEPTSGLDYVTSFNLVSMLKALTEERGVHVSAIVHQVREREGGRQGDHLTAISTAAGTDWSSTP